MNTLDKEAKALREEIILNLREEGRTVREIDYILQKLPVTYGRIGQIIKKIK